MGIQAPEAPGQVAPPLSRREQLGLVAAGGWMVAGLFLDGWAHNHNKPESILTPWHGVFYSGFAVTAWYTLVLARRRPMRGPNAVTGLGLALVGLAIFAAGAAGDQVWHTVFGIEIGVDALLSPTHLLMFCGGVLILGTASRAAWADGAMWQPGFREFLPALLSITLATAVVAFFVMYANPFVDGVFGRWSPLSSDRDLARAYADDRDIIDVSSLLITTVVLVAPLVLVLQRWRPPFGTTTVLFGSVAALSTALNGFDQWPLALAATGAGLLTDVLVARLHPSPQRPWALRTVAAVAPVALWLAYFAVFHAVYGVGWPPELWAGVTVLAGLTGVGLSLLAAPPEVPGPPGAKGVPQA